MVSAERGSDGVDYERLVRSVDDPIFTLDADGRFAFANEALVSTLGYEPDAVTGTPLTDLLPVDHVERARQALEAVTAHDGGTETITFETTLETTGRATPVEVRLSRLADGDDASVAGVVRTVTERRRREERLRRENERLDRFASFVGHDLRNPLEVARTRLELAAETGDSGHLDQAADALDRMERTIDDLLALARDDAGTEADDRVDVATLAREQWSALGTDDATLEATTDRAVVGDRGSLSRLFENLLRNAVEHNSVPVTVTLGDTDDGFFVADDGRGLPEPVCTSLNDGHVFDSQATGIGLAIVETVVGAHGWNLTVTESAAGGARFEVVVE